MKKCLIISGGDYNNLPAEIEYDYIIACDKGLQYATRMNIVPDLAIGDFDSYESDISAYAKCDVKKYPCRKDDSDTMLAIKHALTHGYTHIYITCALGGRMDHTIANLQSMNYIAQNGGICEIISDHEHLIAFTGPEITIPKKDGYSLSLFSMTDNCDNVCIEGAGYNVENVTLTNTFPIGLSNYWENGSVVIKVSSGILLITMSKI